MMNESGAETRQAVAWLPASRSRAAVRGAWWAVAALLSGSLAAFVYSGLDFRPAAITNRVVEYSFALAMVPVALFAAFSGFRALRWLALSAWPAGIGVLARPESLTLKLGPFGTRTYSAERLDVRYPFETLDDDTDEEGGFEAYLPEEQQIARFIPRILHPGAAEPIQRTIQRFVSGDEPQIAAALRPAVEAWRSRNEPKATEP